MRKEPFSVGSYVHVIKRGARGMNIVRDDHDRWRFLRLLRYLNDKNVPPHWDYEITPAHVRGGFVRPDSWDKQEPYTSILAYCLMDNHFHLLMRENKEGGISKFMQRMCTSMSMYFNAKYNEKGTLFQGAYKSRTVDSDDYLQYVAAYIQVKNPLERYPGGLQQAMTTFEEAFDWVLSDPFSSLADYAGRRKSLLLDYEAGQDVFERAQLKRLGREIVEGKIEHGRAPEWLLID